MKLIHEEGTLSIAGGTDSDVETDADHVRNETDTNSDQEDLYATFDLEDNVKLQLLPDESHDS